jgi:hypothetical protein
VLPSSPPRRNQGQPLELILARNLVSRLPSGSPDTSSRAVRRFSSTTGSNPRTNIPLTAAHHDPWHDDAFLEALERDAVDRFRQLGGDRGVTLGREGDAFELTDMDIAPHGPTRHMARALGT